MRNIVLTLALAAAVFGIGSLAGTDNSADPALACNDSYSGRVSVAPYGITTVEIENCGYGGGTGGLHADVSWSGNKSVVLFLKEPDGTFLHYTPSSRHISADVADAAEGTWTIMVKNGSSSQLRADVSAAFD